MAKKHLVRIAMVAVLSISAIAQSQEVLPEDRSWVKYHRSPDWRDSEAHPLRIVAYVFHPIGWLAKEVIFRPFSYFMGATEKTAMVTGYRDPSNFNMGSCLSPEAVPDCRVTPPFNYKFQQGEKVPSDDQLNGMTQIYFPDVNFDFDRRELTTLGKGKARQLALMLNETPGMVVVLEGHTDTKGTPEYNSKLALDRAETVRRELVAMGIDPTRLSTVTFGETEIALSEGDAPADAVNRRVSVKMQK